MKEKLLGFLKTIRTYYLLEHFAWGWFVSFHLALFRVEGVAFWIPVGIAFLGIEVYEFDRSGRTRFFNLDTLLDFVADFLGLYVGSLVWSLGWSFRQGGF